MKKLLLAIVGSVALGVAAPALAADMPVKAAPPPPVAPIYNWTGFYIGAHVGGAWSDTDWFYPCSATNLLILSPCNLAQGGHSGSSWLAGGQVGFNYQVGRFVWGIEADFSATDIKGSNLDAAFPLQEFLHSRTDFIGTVAPRVGVAWDRVLLYAKGGVAWAHDDYWLTLTPIGRPNICDRGRNAVGMDGRRRDRVRIRAKLVRQSRVQLYGFWNQAHFRRQHRDRTHTA